jgi:DNA-binding beta-propeller fold protein YncE
MARRFTAGIGVFAGIAGAINALRPGFVPHVLDRQPVTDADDGKAMATAISTIPVHGHVHDIAVGSYGEHVYVALAESVTVLRGEHRVVATIPLPHHPKDLLMDADGKHLIVSQRGGAASVIDTDTYTVRSLLDPCVSDLVVSPDGRYLYAAHRQDSGRGDADVVTAIDIASGTTVLMLPLDGIAGVAISPDGTLLYALSCDRRTYYQYPAGRLTVVDAASGTIADAIAVGACPETLTVSPDGHLPVHHPLRHAFGLDGQLGDRSRYRGRPAGRSASRAVYPG